MDLMGKLVANACQIWIWIFTIYSCKCLIGKWIQNVTRGSKKMNKNSITFQADFWRVWRSRWIGGISLISRSHCCPNVPYGSLNSNVFLNACSLWHLRAKFKCQTWSSSMKLPLVDRYRSGWCVSGPQVVTRLAETCDISRPHDTKFVNQN